MSYPLTTLLLNLREELMVEPKYRSRFDGSEVLNFPGVEDLEAWLKANVETEFAMRSWISSWKDDDSNEDFAKYIGVPKMPRKIFEIFDDLTQFGK